MKKKMYKIIKSLLHAGIFICAFSLYVKLTSKLNSNTKLWI
jgi:CRISPR/Cas system-associated protein endoribonuclease Cas2